MICAILIARNVNFVNFVNSMIYVNLAIHSRFLIILHFCRLYNIIDKYLYEWEWCWIFIEQKEQIFSQTLNDVR